MMKKQKCHPDSGFSLLEVLAAILIVTFFTTVAMQMLVVSTAFKAKAKEYTTATNLMQQDLEIIRGKAREYEFPTVSPIPTPTATASPTPTTMSIPVPSPLLDAFKNGDEVQFQNTSTVYKILSSGGIVTSPTPAIVIAPTIDPSTRPPNGTRLVNNSLCNPPTPVGTAAPDPTKGLARKLQQQAQTNPNLTATTATEGGVTYTAVSGYNPYTIPGTQMRLWLMRNEELSTTPPYDVLRVRYIVAKPEPRPTSSFYGTLNPGQPTIVAQLSSEVIPNASFQCIR